jgi:hypothetical protein
MATQNPSSLTAKPNVTPSLPSKEQANSLQIDTASQQTNAIEQHEKYTDSPTKPAAPTRDIAIGANQCWAQLTVPARTETQQLTITQKDGHEVHRPSPSITERQQRQITTRDAATHYRVVQPRYKAVQEQVKVSDEVRRLTVVPAVYKDEPQRIMVESARIDLRSCKSKSQYSIGTHRTGQTQCAHEIPARYETVIQRVLVTPETVREDITPAKYQTVTRWVLEEDSKVIENTTPEQSRALNYTAVVQDARLDKQHVPPQIREIPVKAHVGLPTVALRQVVCENQITPPLIRQIQQRLQNSDTSAGPVDGLLGKRTLQAIEAYQTLHGLPGKGHLTHETLQHLGLWPTTEGNTQ